MLRPAFDRRLHPRVVTENRASTVGRGAPIHILDLSFAGALVESEARLVPDCRYPLLLEPGVRLEALVVDCTTHRVQGRHGEERLVYRASLLFVPPDDAQRCQLLLLLRSLAQIEPTTPLPLELAVAV